MRAFWSSIWSSIWSSFWSTLDKRTWGTHGGCPGRSRNPEALWWSLWSILLLYITLSISRLKSINYCVVPAKQSEYVSVTIDGTEFYEVVAHSLRRGCELIKVVWLDADFKKNDVSYSSFELYDVGDEMQFIISTPQRTHRHCIPGFGRLSLQSFPEVARDRPQIFHTAQKKKRKR